MAKQKATSKKRNVRVDAIGQLHVHSSFNNIIVSLANNEGQIISWSSAGKMDFRGSRLGPCLIQSFVNSYSMSLDIVHQRFERFSADEFFRFEDQYF